MNSFHGDKTNSYSNGGESSEKRNQISFGRDEMEDKYLKLQDEHLLLKKHTRNQEEKLKKLSTKVTRLVNDKKRLEEDGSKKKDVEKDDLLQDLEERVRILEKENTHLKEKLLVTKQQVVNNLKRKSQYNYVQPKVDTGIARPSSSQPSNIRSPLQPGLPQYALTLLEEARDEITNLEELVSTQRLQNEMHEQEIETLKEQMKDKEVDHEEEMRAIKTELSHGKRQHVQENIDLIKINREVKHKSSHLTTLQAQYTDLEEKMKQTNQHMKEQIELLTKKLEEQREKNAVLQAESNCTMTLQNTVVQLQAQIEDLNKENILIKESHDKLVNSALEIGSKSGNANEELNHLESVLKTELKERKLLLEQLQTEKEKTCKLETEVVSLKELITRYEGEKNDLKMQIDFFRQEDGINLKEFEEALSFINERKSETSRENEIVDGNGRQERVSSRKVDEMDSELEKTRSMLMLQYKINKECQEDTNKLKEIHQAQIEERDHLLQIRAARIEKLERQMEDIAHGTMPQERAKALGYLMTNKRVTDAALDVLEKPPSTFDNELHIKILRCSSVIARNKDIQPSPYCTYRFYNHPTHETVVIPNTNNPHFNDHQIFSVNETLRLNDSLRKEELVISVYDQKSAGSFLGEAKIPLRNLVKNISVQGKFNLITPEGLNNGTVEVSLYWQKPYLTSNFDIKEDQTTNELPEVPTLLTASHPEQPTEEERPGTESHSVSEMSSSLCADDIGEEVVVSPKLSPRKDDSTIIITINRLELDASASILEDPSIQMLFVEYKFLDFLSEELETPFALPKPTPPQHVTYNFRKVFHVADKTTLLKKMLQTDSRITFTIVSEPPMERQDLDCHDVGVAHVDLLDILQTKDDLNEKYIDVFDMEKSFVKIGMLNVSIEALSVLKRILPDKK